MDKVNILKIHIGPKFFKNTLVRLVTTETEVVICLQTAVLSLK